MTSSRSRPSAAIAGHIAGLDGLRAFAVIAVIAFHLWPEQVPGGFLGVDVFFVISGFLITTLLVREGDRSGRVDLPSFWLRRARRLLPALLLVVVTSIVAARIVSTDLLVGIDRQTLGALTFSSNWLEASAGADYFNHSAPTLFATFWSLAVEEQFYLLWPLSLVAILALATSSVMRVRVALGIAAASAAWMAFRFVPGSNPTRVYYGTDTHLFGLMIGAALALAYAGDVGIFTQRRWQRLRQWVGFAALGGLTVMVVTVRSESTFTYRGGILMASVLSGVVVASLPGPRSPLTTALHFRPLEWVGERSYGIYLWHWPVILIAAAVLPAVAPGAAPAPSTVAVCLLLTFGLAAASYRWLEMPVRDRGFSAIWVRLRRVPQGWMTSGSLLVIAGIIVATAPDKSDAQLAVERGERAIAAQTPVAAHTNVTQAPPATEAPGPLAWPAELPVPTGDLMIGLGDSVLSGAAPAVYERFPGILLDAKPIRQWRDAPELVRAALTNQTIRPVVVLSFGTNAGLVSDESQGALRSVLDELGADRRVVLVNTVGISDWVPSSNATLAAISAEYPNTIVVDWHATVSADPTLLHSDRTHPNMEGIAVYADLIASALQALGPG